MHGRATEGGRHHFSAVELIAKKRDGGKLSREEIGRLVKVRARDDAGSDERRQEGCACWVRGRRRMEHRREGQRVGVWQRDCLRVGRRKDTTGGRVQL